MASLLALQTPRLLTAEEFLQIDFGPDLKAELDNGVIRMMAGGTREHARIQANIIAAFHNALRGSGCRPYGSDMALQAHGKSVRYPDVSVDCGGPSDRPDDLVLTDPRVVIEVLSPSTRHHDLTVKRTEYQAIPTVATVALVDPEGENITLLQRTGDSWSETLFSTTIDLAVPTFDLVMSRADIFASD